MTAPSRGPALATVALCLLALLPSLAKPIAAPALQPDDPPPVLERELALPDGPLAWLVRVQDPIDDDSPALDVLDGVLFAPDVPLLVLHENGDSIERVRAGDGLPTRAEDRLRPVGAEAGGSWLAIAVAPAETDAAGGYDAVGDVFTAPASTVQLRLWRHEIGEPGREVSALQVPALLVVLQGAVVATAAGDPAGRELPTHEAVTIDDDATITPADDDTATVLLVTLEARPDPATEPAPGGTTEPGATRPTETAPTGTEPPDPTAEAATVATVVPTAPATDTDGDGLSDTDELARGTDPASDDSDGDGVFDGFEVSVGLDPLKPDTDGDGVSDYLEVPDEPSQGSGDTDGDGLTDGYEEQVSRTDPNAYDTDFDGLHDGDEVSRGADPLNRDSDGDGLTDGTDVAWGASPTSRDTDGDGLSDGFEVGQGSSPVSIDSDGDGVDDGYETGRGMNFLATDSDGDGLADGDELWTHLTNPLNIDSDGDCLGDGVEIRVGANTFSTDTDGDGDDDNREYQAYLDTGAPYFSDPTLSLTDGPAPPCHLT